MKDEQIITNPTQQFKMDILNLKNKATSMDVEQRKREYITSVKHLHWNLIKYIPKSYREKLSKLIKLMDEELNKLKKTDLTTEQKEKRELDIKYFYYDKIMNILTLTFISSPIIEEEIEGILQTGKTIDELKEITEKIRSTSIKDVKIIDMGQFEEGVENID